MASLFCKEFRRITMKTIRTLLLVCSVLLATIQPWVVAKSASPLDAAPAAGETQHLSVAVEWSYTIDDQTSWQSSEVVESHTEQTSMSGSALVTYDRVPSSAQPIINVQVNNFRLLVRYNMENV